ncbi:hypothetical protein PG988_003462 [Apiospora saccharicola]
MSLEDQLYFALAMTIRVFDRVEPAAAETHGNATALLVTLGQLRGGPGTGALRRPVRPGGAEGRGVFETELVEMHHRLSHTLELVMDVAAAVGDVRDGSRKSRDRLVLAEQADISLARGAAETDVLVNSKRWKLRLEQRVARISELREQLRDKDQNNTMHRQFIEEY